MQFVRNLRIGQRMALGFAAVIGLMVIIAVIGIHRVNLIERDLHSINEVNSVKQRMAINLRGSVHDRAIALRDVVLSDDSRSRTESIQGIDALARDYAASAAPMSAMLASSKDAKETALLKRIEANEANVLPLLSRVIALRDAGDVEAAKSLMLSQAKPAFVAWLSSINAFIDLQESKTAVTSSQLTATTRGFAMLMIGATLLALVLGSLIAVALTRSVVRPMGMALRAAKDVSEGRLDTPLVSDRRDEAGQLLLAMEQMRQRVRSVISDLGEMTHRHALGEISHRMNPEAYPGEFGVMVSDTNAIVAAHISIKMQLVRLIGRYAVGDLSGDMERLPGEKAIITETMDQVKANLSSISRDIRELTQAASEGDFSARGTPSDYQYDFRTMVENLNGLMGIAEQNLADLSAFLNTVASGNLGARMEGDFRGVFATMGADANKTATNLADIVRRIHSASEAITGAATELSNGNRDLSQRTEQQAASLEETAASMEELTSTVKQNASSADEAHRLAMEAAAVAGRGGRIVGEVVSTMAGIESSSRRIAEITSVIDSIAFQTNILALNAAVEAARAGDQGRGFVVVASEVRSLAQRAASSAKEIKDLIDDAGARIAEGSTLVTTAGSTMDEVVSSVQRVTSIMQEISSASREQSSSIEQVNGTIGRMDETTQQNAALVEEAAAAATELETQASGLREAVSVFKIDRAIAPRATAPYLRAVAAQ